jgi:hypothetical protein
MKNGVGWSDAEWTVRNRLHLENCAKNLVGLGINKKGIVGTGRTWRVYRDAHYKMT